MSFGDRVTRYFNQHKSTIIVVMLLLAMVGFELFNFATTRGALDYFFGSATLLGIPWAVLIAVPACLVDFAGLSRIFTPQTGRDEPKSVWLTMGGWGLAAILNAGLTWYATVEVMATVSGLGNEIISRDALLLWFPIGIALFVLLIRITLIGSLNVAGEAWEAKRAPVGGMKFPPLRKPKPVEEPKNGKEGVPLSLETIFK